MTRFAEAVAASLLYVATFSGIVLTTLVALSAVMRYVIGAPFAFTEEIVGLLFSALVFLALPYVTLQRKHIEVTILTDIFPPGLRRITDLIALLLILLFCIWFGTYAFDFVYLSFELNSRSDIGGFSLWPWMGTMVLACVLMGIFAVILLIHRRNEAISPSTPTLH